MKKLNGRRWFLSVLLVSLCLFLTACSAFPHLEQILRGESKPLTLEISIAPSMTDAAVSREPHTDPVNDVVVTVDGGSGGILTLTVRIR